VIADYAQATGPRAFEPATGYPAMTGRRPRLGAVLPAVRERESRLSIAGLDVSGGTADAQVTGTYTYLNTSTGRTESQPVSFHASLRNEGGKWR